PLRGPPPVPDSPAAPAPIVSYEDFRKLDIRVGTIVAVEDFPEARRPAFRLQGDFGAPIGVKRSSAQLVANSRREALLGRQVAAVVNFAPKQIGKFMSEILVLGFPDAVGEVRLIVPEGAVPNGGRLY